MTSQHRRDDVGPQEGRNAGEEKGKYAKTTVTWHITEGAIEVCAGRGSGGAEGGRGGGGLAGGGIVAHEEEEQKNVRGEGQDSTAQKQRQRVYEVQGEGVKVEGQEGGGKDNTAKLQLQRVRERNREQKARQYNS